MSITPGFLDELRHRLVLSDLVGRKVQWDKRKSNPRRRDFWGCCPFHHEKSPSFHVEDDKGRYYCFGCGAKGDAVSFVMETENLEFREAVEQLASLAGMEVPAQTREAAVKEKARASQIDLLTEAQAFFASCLRAPMGNGAQAYLQRRGLSQETIAAFGIGFAPGTGHALIDHLKAKGADVKAMIAAGLAGQRDQSRPPYDYFRGRLIFPIKDRRGRVIGFGGRALEDGVEPKYLNSPETEVFKKGQVLYNLDRARGASRDAGGVIAAEGYMDVIAFDRAGLPAAVAPLGTALTETQLGELWRLTPEPVLCFDGDGAGLKAAYRVLDLALPMVTPTQTLRFALLPQGQDPDDVLRDAGAGALKAAIATAGSVADLLWRRESTLMPLDTPERKAGLEARINEALEQISDQTLRYHFKQDMRTRTQALFRQQREEAFSRTNGKQNRPGLRSQGSGRKGGRPFGFAAPTASPELKASLLARASTAGRAGGGARANLSQIETMMREVRDHVALRERALLALALDFPVLIETDPERFAALNFEDSDNARLARALLSIFEEHDGLDRQALKGHLIELGLGLPVEKVGTCGYVRANRVSWSALQSEQIDARWQDMISRHHIVSATSTELRHALEAFREASTEENENRLMTLRRQIDVVMAPKSGRDGERGTPL